MPETLKKAGKIRVYDPYKGFNDAGKIRTRYRLGGANFVKMAGRWHEVWYRDGEWKLGSETDYPAVNPACKNPLLFRTRAAALKYAREHGAKKFSIKKLKRGK